ncbi:unnamed protein product [Hymenolepis diminuta]|uniref:SH2 domain-containing protein n=1 Tax=Hymenolepis diminuta TaxID=6216 RepID=A0A0R3S8H1_HYMDI|nr:unnamed protein product [Hymenolepis diminuta]
MGMGVIYCMSSRISLHALFLFLLCLSPHSIQSPTSSSDTQKSFSFSSIRAELPPIPSSSSSANISENGITRSSSLRAAYAAPNTIVNSGGSGGGGIRTAPGRHHSCAAAPSLSHPSPAISSMSWYYGEMDRAEATQLLKGCEDGTFLVRISKNVSRMGEYSLSVVYHHPRHIRIQRTPDSCFYLCTPQRFNSLGALVDFYCCHSLNECFDEVQTRLRFPYQRCPDSVLFYARAQYDFEGDSNPHMLPLSCGDIVHVISTRAKEQAVLAIAAAVSLMYITRKEVRERVEEPYYLPLFSHDNLLHSNHSLHSITTSISAALFLSQTDEHLAFAPSTVGAAGA